MNLKKYILMICLVIITICTIMLPVNAKRHHIRTYKRARSFVLFENPVISKRPLDKTYRSNYKYYSKHNFQHLSKQELAERARTLEDLNKDRRSKHLFKLKYSKALDKIAQIRSRQIIMRFNHYSKKHQLYILNVARLLHIRALNHSWCGENIQAESNTGLNGISEADSANYELWNDERHPHHKDGGHRQNIEDPHFKYVGIGSFMHNSTYYLAEVFSSRAY